MTEQNENDGQDFTDSRLRADLAAITVAALAWGGPSAAFAQRYTGSNAEIAGGGFVPGIIFHPTERGLVYARTDIDGAHRLDHATPSFIAVWARSTGRQPRGVTRRPRTART